MTKITHAMQVTIAVVIALWSYDAYTTKVPAVVGNETTNPGVHEAVDKSNMEDSYHSGYVIVAYGYLVSGRRNFAAHRRARFERHDYPNGPEITIFYFFVETHPRNTGYISPTRDGQYF